MFFCQSYSFFFVNHFTPCFFVRKKVITKKSSQKKQNLIEIIKKINEKKEFAFYGYYNYTIFVTKYS